MSTKTENYVVNHYEYAKKAGERFKMDPLVILSQGAFESAWGTSALATKYNNFFGITAGGKPNEFWKGGVYQAQNQYKLKNQRNQSNQAPHQGDFDQVYIFLKVKQRHQLLLLYI